MKFIKYYLCFISILPLLSYAQTCTGSFGEPVVNLTFSSGPDPGPSMATNYNYTTNSCPNDGSYTITNSTPGCFGNRWHTFSQDHTPGDENGYMMLVNASYSPGEFYKQTISDLCPGTTYEFAAYVVNVLKTSAAGIKPDLTFIIESVRGDVLGTYSTGQIVESNAPEWKKYGLIFTTTTGISQVVLKIINNAPGGKGNDLALDDITFRACGPTIQTSINGGQDPVSVCEGQSSTLALSTEISSGYTNPAYQWQISTSNSQWQDIPGANSRSADIGLTGGAGKEYRYRLAVAESGNINSVNCRVLSDPMAVKVIPKLIVNFAVPEVCITDQFALFTDSTTISDKSAQFVYLWNFGDARATSSNPDTSSIKDPKHKYTLAGNYQVTLTVISKDGCETTLTKPFQVNGATPKADFIVLNPGQLCSNREVVFTNTSSVDFGTIGKVEWYFDYGGASMIKFVDDNPEPGKQYRFQYPIFSSPASKDFVVRLLAYSGGSCVNEYRQAITVKAAPKVSFIALANVCQEVPPFRITQALEINNQSGTGNFYGKGVSLSGIFDPAKAGLGTHAIKYVFTASNGCADSLSQDITVMPSPMLYAGRDTIILEGGETKLNSVAKGSNLIYKWMPARGLSRDDIPDPIANPVNDVTYTLTVTSDQGCVAIDDIFIKVLKLPEVPNTFTPNGDGVNDVWNIKYLNSYVSATVQIFNRYGIKIFSSLGYSIPWDGTFTGTDLPVGTYYYIIEPKSGRKAISGSITIIK